MKKIIFTLLALSLILPLAYHTKIFNKNEVVPEFLVKITPAEYQFNLRFAAPHTLAFNTNNKWFLYTICGRRACPPPIKFDPPLHTSIVLNAPGKFSRTFKEWVKSIWENADDI